VQEVLEQYEIDVDEDLVLSVIAQESCGNRWAISEDGWHSVGLMQIIPHPYFSWRPSTEWLLNPRNNIRFGARLLETVIDRAGGSKFTGLRYYNCGYSRVDAGSTCATWYAKQVLTYWMPRIKFGNDFLGDLAFHNHRKFQFWR
jgi:soluble lytic murein transglycosylase-like protein